MERLMKQGFLKGTTAHRRAFNIAGEEDADSDLEDPPRLTDKQRK